MSKSAKSTWSTREPETNWKSLLLRSLTSFVVAKQDLYLEFPTRKCCVTGFRCNLKSIARSSSGMESWLLLIRKTLKMTTIFRKCAFTTKCLRIFRKLTKSLTWMCVLMSRFSFFKKNNHKLWKFRIDVR